MNKVSAWWLLVFLLIGIAAAYLYLNFFNTPSETVTIRKRPRHDVITLSLPNSSDPAIFGPHYWKAFHSLTDRIPCPTCRAKAVPFMRFFHDIVNKGTGKSIFDKQNFDYHIEMIKKIDNA